MFSRMSRPSCPTCKGPLRPHAENPAHPFCSPRCKLADLSNWLNERYSLPAEESQPGEDDVMRDEPLLN
jgi:uncharacterized protein